MYVSEEPAAIRKMEAAGSSEVLLHHLPNMQHHIPEDCNLNIHCHKNLKHHIKNVVTSLCTIMYKFHIFNMFERDGWRGVGTCI
jgi:hypothetical protein